MAEASSEPGLEEETAPVVRPRPRNSPRVEARVVLHGRVLDPDGRPIPRALVSASSRRGLEESHGGATPSWRDPDSLYSEETLTDARGRFQLSLVPSRWYPLAVFAPSGRREKFPRFFVDPSKGVDDLELRLAPATRLLLDLRDDEGSPLPRSRHFPSRGLAAGSTLPRVQILAELVGGERLSTLAAVGGHDLYSAQFYCPREDIVAVTVEAPGFEPRRLELDPTPRGDEERLQLELTPR